MCARRLRACVFQLSATAVVALWFVGRVLSPAVVAAQPAALEPGAERSGSGQSAPGVEDVLLEVQQRIAASEFEQARALLDSGVLDEADRLALSGFVGLLEGDCGRALPEFRRVLELRPSRSGVWLYVAQCELMLGDAAAAAGAWARGVDAGRQLPDVWLLGAQIELAAGHRAESWRIAGAAGERFDGDDRFEVHQRRLAQQLGLRWLPQVWRAAPLEPDAAPWDLAWRLYERVQGVRGGDALAPVRSWSVAGTSESPAERIQRLVDGGEFTRALALGASVQGSTEDAVCDALIRAALEVGDTEAVRRWVECATPAWQQVARGWLAR